MKIFTLPKMAIAYNELGIPKEERGVFDALYILSGGKADDMDIDGDHIEFLIEKIEEQHLSEGMEYPARNELYLRQIYANPGFRQEMLKRLREEILPKAEKYRLKDIIRYLLKI
jgi:hypothetical protein